VPLLPDYDGEIWARTVFEASPEEIEFMSRHVRDIAGIEHIRDVTRVIIEGDHRIWGRIEGLVGSQITSALRGSVEHEGARAALNINGVGDLSIKEALTIIFGSDSTVEFHGPAGVDPGLVERLDDAPLCEWKNIEGAWQCFAGQPNCSDCGGQCQAVATIPDDNTSWTCACVGGDPDCKEKRRKKWQKDIEDQIWNEIPWWGVIIFVVVVALVLLLIKNAAAARYAGKGTLLIIREAIRKAG
jgi:hypothetical protein